MKYSIIPFLLFFCFNSYSQDIDADKLCENFRSFYSDSLTFDENKESYNIAIDAPLSKLEQSEREKILFNLVLICPETRPYNPMSGTLIKPIPLDEEKMFEEFLNSISEIKWTNSQIEEQVAKCHTEISEKKKCSKAIKEIAEHINYDEFSELTEFQKGRLVGQIRTWLEK